MKNEKSKKTTKAHQTEKAEVKKPKAEQPATKTTEKGKMGTSKSGCESC
jgi:hypothetical protein